MFQIISKAWEIQETTDTANEVLCKCTCFKAIFSFETFKAFFNVLVLSNDTFFAATVNLPRENYLFIFLNQKELCNMILDCCAQQRTYEKFFGLLAGVSSVAWFYTSW